MEDWRCALEGLEVMLDSRFWANKKVLITGNTGFKGSWITMLLKNLGAQVCGYSLAPPTKPSLFELCQLQKEIQHHTADIRETERLTEVIQKFQPDIFFHMAAQPLVRESYRNPMETYSVNAMGTCSVLESTRKARTANSSKLVFINVTTDKVYENKEQITPYQESDRLGGFDPYSNSKACSEMITQSFRDSFFPISKQSEHKVLIATARAGNVIGGGDWSSERLVPDFFNALLSNEPLTIRSPDAVRPWQHVLESVSGYLTLAQKLYSENYSGQYAWNFGPNKDDFKTVKQVIDGLQTQAEKLANKKVKVSFDSSQQPHEAHLLTLDSTKAKKELNWGSAWNFETTLAKTSQWYLAFASQENMREKSNQQIKEYIQCLPSN